AVDLLGFDAAGEQQDRSGDDGDFWHGPSGEEEDDHAGGHGERFPKQRAVDAHRAMLHLKRRAQSEFRSIDEGDDGDGEDQSSGCHGRQLSGERAVGDQREAADHHVLWIARDGGHTADIGGHGDGQQVGDGFAAQAVRDVEHQRGEDQAHGVVHEEGGEYAAHQHDTGEQDQRSVRVIHYPRGDGGEEAGEPQIGHHDHHAEQQDDGVVIDGGVRLLHGEDVEGEHEAGADNGRAGAVHAQEGDAADGENEVGAGENEDGGEQALIFALSARSLRTDTIG